MHLIAVCKSLSVHRIAHHKNCFQLIISCLSLETLFRHLVEFDDLISGVDFKITSRFLFLRRVLLTAMFLNEHCAKQ